MIDISNHLCIIPANLMKGYLTPECCRYIPHGAIDIICSRKIILDQTPVTDIDGKRWSISMSSATKDETIKSYDGQEVYVGIVLTDGTVRILATSGYIPRLSVTPYANAYAISVSYEALKAINL